MSKKQAAVYILANQKNRVIYTGATADLPQRIADHRNGSFESFTKQYNINTLVYFEWHDELASAKLREKSLKKWTTPAKMELIATKNPTWKDLGDEII